MAQAIRELIVLFSFFLFINTIKTISNKSAAKKNNKSEKIILTYWKIVYKWFSFCDKFRRKIKIEHNMPTTLTMIPFEIESLRYDNDFMTCDKINLHK